MEVIQEGSKVELTNKLGHKEEGGTKGNGIFDDR